MVCNKGHLWLATVQQLKERSKKAVNKTKNEMWNKACDNLDYFWVAQEVKKPGKQLKAVEQTVKNRVYCT